MGLASSSGSKNHKWFLLLKPKVWCLIIFRLFLSDLGRKMLAGLTCASRSTRRESSAARLACFIPLCTVAPRMHTVWSCVGSILFIFWWRIGKGYLRRAVAINRWIVQLYGGCFLPSSLMLHAQYRPMMWFLLSSLPALQHSAAMSPWLAASLLQAIIKLETTSPSFSPRI